MFHDYPLLWFVLAVFKLVFERWAVLTPSFDIFADSSLYLSGAQGAIMLCQAIEIEEMLIAETRRC